MMRQASRLVPDWCAEKGYCTGCWRQFGSAGPADCCFVHSRAETVVIKGMAKKEEKFEQTLERLQSLVRELEAGECSLEDSIKKFEEGMALARSCQDRLSQAEQKIEVLLRADKDGVKTAPFPDQE